MQTHARRLLTVAVLLIAGCAQTPAVKTAYYLPRARVDVQVVQSLSCVTPSDGTPQQIIRAEVASFSPTYERNPLLKQTLDFSALQGTFSDSDVSINTTPDGRLVGVNATGSGQGSAVVQALVTLGLTGLELSALSAGPPVDQALNDAPLVKQLCANVAAMAKPKAASPGSASQASVATVMYATTLVFDHTASSVPSGESASVVPVHPATPDNSASNTSALTPCPVLAPPTPASGADARLVLKPCTVPVDADSQDVFNLLTRSGDGKVQQALDQFLEPALSVSMGPTPLDRFTPPAKLDDIRRVVVIPNVYATAIIVQRAEALGNQTKGSPPTTVGTATLDVPTDAAADVVLVPIPAPEPFGTTTFALSVSDSGEITKLEYGTKGGPADVINSVNSVATPFTPEAIAQREQGVADRIYQTQRAAICQSTPASCPSK